MYELFQTIFTLGNFEHHAMHFANTPILVNGFYVTNAIIAASYFSILVGLVYLVKKRNDLPFNWIFFGFAAFILSCGTTHLLHIVVLTYPLYYLELLADIVTAMTSVIVAVSFWILMPHILKIPSLTLFRETNEKLNVLNGELLEKNAELEKKWRNEKDY